jgi:MFS family permease
MLNRNMRLLFISLFFWGFGFGLYWYIFPIYAMELGASAVQVGLIFSVAFIAATLSYIPGGILADKYDRKSIMLVGWLLGTFSVLIFAFANTWLWLGVGMIIYMISGFCMPAVNAYITDSTSKSSLASTFTIIWSSSSFALIFAPAIGGYISEVVDMKNLFFLSFVFFSLSTFICVFIGKQKPNAGMVKTSYRDLFKDKRLLKYSLLFGAVLFFLNMPRPFLPIYLEGAKGLTIFWVGVLGSISSLGAGILSFICGKYGKKVKSGILLATFMIIFSFALIILILAHSIPLFSLSLFLTGVVITASAVMVSIVGKDFSTISLGKAYGVYSTITGVAFILSPYIGGILFEYSPDLLFFITITALSS